MYNVSELFRSYSSLFNREFDVKAVIGTITYLRDTIVEFEIVDSLVPGETFTIGSVIASTLNISVKTADVIPSNAKIVPYIRLNGAGGYSEWMPLGEFYIDNRKLQNNVWKFSCYDKFILGQDTYISTLIYPATMSAVLNEACTQIGIAVDSGVIINTGYKIQSKPEGMSVRDVISGIAACHGANTKINKDGKLKFIICLSGDDKTTITASDHFRMEQTNPIKTYTKVMAAYNQDEDVLVAGDLNADEDHTLKFYSPFITQTHLNAIFNNLTEFSYMPFAMEWRGFPQLEVGDAIEVTQLDGSKFSSVIFINKITFKGGMKFSSSSPSIGTNRSEFNFGGGVKKYVQTVTKDIEQSILYYTNENAITVNTTAQKPVYLSIAATKDTNLKVLVAIYGTASVANILTIEIQLDNADIVFTPKQKTQAGDNIIGIPIGIPQVRAGGHYLGIILKTDTGTFTIPINNIQVTVEGGSLEGGLSAEYPHFEGAENQVYLNLNEGYYNKIQGSYSFSFETPIPWVNSESLSYTTEPGNLGNITAVYNISLKKLGQTWDINSNYTSLYNYESTYMILDSTGLSYRTTYTSGMQSSSIDSGYMDTGVLVDITKYSAIEEVTIV